MSRGIVLSLLLVMSTPAWAQEDSDAREAEMFGEEAPSDDARDDAIFGGDPADASDPTPDSTPDVTEDIADKLEEADRALTFGGFLFLQLNYAIPEDSTLEERRLSAPSLFDLFADVRPNDRVRAYARARLNFDFTIPATQASDAQANPLGGVGDVPGLGSLVLGAGAGRQQTQVALDQLWLKFDVARAIYVTVGRQRIRWGASRFFNPTDFLNAAQLNPVALFDARLGVDMIKVHLPLEAQGWNFYFLGALGQADTLEDVGGAFRAELLLWDAELALSFFTRRQVKPGPREIPNPILEDRPPLWAPEGTWPKDTIPVRMGADISGPLGPLDGRLEVAVTYGDTTPFYRGWVGDEQLGALDFSSITNESRADTPIVQASAGLEWIWQYNEQDTLILGAEYFYNGAGYDDSDLYLWLFLQGAYRPLYTGRHYAALAALLPAPGDWDDTSFTLSTLSNLSDLSFLSRLDISHRLHNELSWNLSAMYQYGQNGEFNYGFTFPTFPGGAEVPPLKAPEWMINTGLRMNF